MGKSLAEYAQESGLHEQPADEVEAVAAIAADIDRRAAQVGEAQRIKESITQQLAAGVKPQYILYAALDCIGLLANDEEWTAEGKARLDHVYGDLAQQSFIIDNAAIAGKRLKAETEAYNKRLRGQLQRQQGAYRKIAAHINDALAELDRLEGKNTGLDWTDEILKDE